MFHTLTAVLATEIFSTWQQERISQMCVSHVKTALFIEKSCTWAGKLVMGV